MERTPLPAALTSTSVGATPAAVQPDVPDGGTAAAPLEWPWDFTADDVEQGTDYGSLSPEYFAARRVSEAVMAKFEAEHLKPLIDKAAEEFRDKLWDDLRDYIIGDTEMNVQTAICHMVEGTIRALLTGEEWAMQRYPYCDYRDGEKIRKAIAVHSGDAIAQQRIADLEKEVKQLREDIAWHRGSQF